MCVCVCRGVWGVRVHAVRGVWRGIAECVLRECVERLVECIERGVRRVCGEGRECVGYVERGVGRVEQGM